MRQVLTFALTALLLTGCGAQANLTGTYAQAPSLSAKAIRTTEFTQVLRHEHAVWETASEAARAFIVAEKPRMLMQPLNREQVATSVWLNELAARPLADGGRELIGKATFLHTIQGSFVTPQADRAVRLVINAQGRASQFTITGETLPAKVVAPTFRAVASGETHTLMADLTAFLLQPAQAEIRKTPLWGAIAGTNATNTFTVGPVIATKSNFGAFGRIFRFRGTLKHRGVTVISERDMELEVVTDKQGRIIGVN